jgi:hypothetical protein
MRSLAKKREARYQSASEFRSMLMQKNTSAVTRPLDDRAARTGGYAAPATQVDQTMRMAPPSGDVVKATRLSADQNYAPAATGGDVKATRLGQPDAAGAYSQGAPGYYAPSPVAQNAPAQASFLSKLNWKHYAAAGAVFFVILVAVIAGAFVLLGGGGKQEAVQPSPAAPPPVEAQSPSAPAAQSEAAPVPAQVVQPPPGQPAPVVSGNQPPVVGSTSPGTSTARPRAGAPKTADAPPSVSVQTPPAQPPPQQAQPAPKQEKVAATKPEPEKKEPEKKPEEKKRGIFGKLKDAITGGGDKKKDPKKP